jgi:indolepyruvate ferredoxin oxidoreductase beta subunit
MKQAMTVLIAALGGEGGSVLAEWLVETATEAGYPAQSTSIPGVAQRTGATTYYVEIYPEKIAALAGRVPVLSLLPVPGCIDLLVASELLECARTVQHGMASAERTTVITSTSRSLTTAEKIALGDGRFDSDRLRSVASENSRKLIALDMEAMARGTVVSAVMFGAIAASGVLPFAREEFEAVIKSSGVGVESSLLGFARAWDGINAAPGLGAPHAESPATHAHATASHSILGGRFPPAIVDIVDAGQRRMTDYQDDAYAELYLSRVSRVLAVERQSDAAAVNGFALTRETARFLALWMAFDDIVRVADLKCRGSRFARVRAEVAARDGDIVRIVDHFKPGITEFCALLPAAIAGPLIAWDLRRQARGKPTLAMALHLRTDSVSGFLLLRVLASLRWLRRSGARYAQEQALIESWLSAIENAARDSWTLANEIALCGRLIKGYGTTNERAKANWLHILDQLIKGGTFATPAERASAIRQAREAALADEGGKAFDQVLVQQGALARPVKAQPIRWSRKTPVQKVRTENPAA